MVGMGFKAARASFFDRAVVLRATDRATREVLSRFGAYVRTRARTSIRSRKAVSAPGQPPSSHVGTLKRLILFAYDAGRKSVVIGPTQSRPNSAAPRLLEYGGTAAGPARRPRRGGPPAPAGAGTRLLSYRARPFMTPAFDAELPGLPAMWANSVRR